MPLIRSLTASLSANQGIQKRLAEIQSLGAERAAITVETLTYVEIEQGDAADKATNPWDKVPLNEDPQRPA
jgi:hypothetical protein